MPCRGFKKYGRPWNPNARFKKSGKPGMKLVAADDIFEDEDLLEMVNAGLIPMIIMDSHKAHFWTQIFDKIKVHDNIACAIKNNQALTHKFKAGKPTTKYFSVLTLVNYHSKFQKPAAPVDIGQLMPHLQVP